MFIDIDPQAENERRSAEYIECVAVARTWFDTVAPHRRVLSRSYPLDWYWMTQRIGSELLFIKRRNLGIARMAIELREQMSEIGYSTTRDRDILNLRSCLAVVDMLRGNTRRMDEYRALMTMSMNGVDPHQKD